MITSLGDALRGAASLPWTHALYAPVAADFSDERLSVLVWDVDDVSDDDDLPEAARALGYEYVLGVVDLQGIVANAWDQRPEANVADLLVAFRHYVDRDAFVDWSSGSPH
ncbi:hypothetical protein ABLE92_08240 [Gordonia sp. VNQ95]|uniref:DUF7716 domain-containing protein n=1 Tax=Gordonia TaxID=2053 RepID=UPI0032B34707